MENISSLKILEGLANYGVLGLGWFAWILTMAYMQAERRRYQALVIYIIKFLTTRTPAHDDDPGKALGELFDSDKPRHKKTLDKLFGKDSTI